MLKSLASSSVLILLPDDDSVGGEWGESEVLVTPRRINDFQSSMLSSIPVRCSKHDRTAAFGDGGVNGFDARNNDLYNRRTTTEEETEEGDDMI